MSRPQKIVVYTGKGADHRTLMESLKTFFKGDPTTEICEADTIEPMDPDDVIAVFLPGGGQANYDVTIGQDGFKNIRNYVEAGGNLVCFCAGSYYASQKIEWMMGLGDMQRTKQPGLNFFNGIARGPVTATTGPIGDIHKARAMNVTYRLPHKDLKMKSLYWGGPIFIPHDMEDQAFETLAEFSDLDGKPPCVIRSQVGKGTVTLSSIHPEAPAKKVANFLRGEYHSDEERLSVAGQLVAHEKNRISIFRDIIYQIIDHYDRRRPKPVHEGILTP